MGNKEEDDKVNALLRKFGITSDGKILPKFEDLNPIIDMIPEFENIEQERLALVVSYKDMNWEDFKPGSFGYHEALHTTLLAMDFVSQNLCSHLAIVADAELYALADEIQMKLCALYQKLGAQH